MQMGVVLRAALTGAVMVVSLPAVADTFTFSTGSPDGRIATLSAPGGGLGQSQAETADDFVLSQPTSITQATFTGLIPLGERTSHQSPMFRSSSITFFQRIQ